MNSHLTHTESVSGADFIFHPRVHPKFEKPPKPERTLKETQENREVKVSELVKLF
jgi:hypothetical protein